MNADPIAALSSALGMEAMVERLDRLETTIQVLSAKLEQRAKHEGSAVTYSVAQAAAAMDRPSTWLNQKIAAGLVPTLRLSAGGERRIAVAWTYQLADILEGADLAEEPLRAPTTQRVMRFPAAAKWLGIGLTTAHDLRKSGDLPSKVIDGRPVVAVPQMVAWLENLMALSVAQWRERRRGRARDRVLAMPHRTRRAS